jgi:hypothetical protein
MLIDPHGMLARDVLMLLRKEYTTEQEFNSKVIYINPEITNYRINPLQIEDYKKEAYRTYVIHISIKEPIRVCLG